MINQFKLLISAHTYNLIFLEGVDMQGSSLDEASLTFDSEGKNKPATDIKNEEGLKEDKLLSNNRN